MKDTLPLGKGPINDLNHDEMLDIIEHDLKEARPYHDDVMSEIATWMNEYNVRRNFTNPVHLEPIFTAASTWVDHVHFCFMKVLYSTQCFHTCIL